MPSTTPTVSRRLIKQADKVPKGCTRMGWDLLTDLTVAFFAASVRSLRISSFPPNPLFFWISGGQECWFPRRPPNRNGVIHDHDLRAAAHRIVVPGAQGPTCIEATSLAISDSRSSARPTGERTGRDSAAVHARAMSRFIKNDPAALAFDAASSMATTLSFANRGSSLER
jgi:hypothetical protein